MRTITLVILLSAGLPLASFSSPTTVKRTSLDGTWAMRWAKPGAGESLGNAGEAPPPGEWVPCQVPGTAQAAMLAAGKIPDPYFARQNLSNLWMEKKEWWFRREFAVHGSPASRYWIEFDGVDHYGTVYLNGKLLGRHTGMFDPFALDVTEQLRKNATNVLTVKIAPPPQVDKAGTELKSQVYYCSQSLWIGWAYVRMLTIGIWKSVRLVEMPVARIQHPFIRTLDATDALAHLRISGQVVAPKSRDRLVVELVLRGANCPAPPQSFLTSVMFDKNENGVFDATVEIRHPQLWWPNGLGAQNLYTVNLRLADGNGALLDELTVRFGIRTIKTIRNPGSKPGWLDWTVCVNDKPFFVRGANWIPPTDVLLREMPGKTRHFIWLARQAGMNMFRIWGGGPTESDTFYDLCDEYGILTQEESPLGIPGVDYKVDPTQYRDVVTAQVLQTRNHPCLAIYCGGNEWSANLPRNKALVEILRQVTTDLDGTRIFRPVSPWGGDAHDYAAGDSGGNYTLFNRDGAPFMSEFGAYASPSYESLKRFIPDYELQAWPPTRDSSFFYHQIYGRTSVLNTILEYAQEYGAIRNYHDLPPQSQLSAARQNAYCIGHLRADWPRKSGVTVWELKDMWPAVSTGQIDYYGIPKTGYYFIKRAYAPVALFSRFATDFWPPGSRFNADIHIVSDDRNLKGCTVQAEIYDARLRPLAASNFPAQAVAGSSRDVGQFQWQVPEGDAFPFLYITTLRRADGTTVASDPYWLNLRALYGFESPDLDQIHFELGDPTQSNAVRCAGQEIEFKPVTQDRGVSFDAIAFLMAAAGTTGGEKAEFKAKYSEADWGNVEYPDGGVVKKSVYVPDWWTDGRWSEREYSPGVRFAHQLGPDKSLLSQPANLHVIYVPLIESAYLTKITLPAQPAGQKAFVVFAAAVKQDHQWRQIDISNLYNCDAVGREGQPDSGDFLGGTAFYEPEWKRHVTVTPPDVPNARLMDLMARTSLSGKLRTRKDGAAEVQIRNTGGHPAFLAEVCVGQEALGQYIPDDNFFWLAPGEKRVVLIEKSPAAKVRLKKDAIRLRAWNAPPVSIE